MASCRFEREPVVEGGKNVLEFDSSHDRALSRAFGWEEGSVELREISRTEQQIDYEVFSRSHGGTKLIRRGVLKQIPGAEILRRQSAGTNYGVRFN